MHSQKTRQTAEDPGLRRERARGSERMTMKEEEEGGTRGRRWRSGGAEERRSGGEEERRSGGEAECLKVPKRARGREEERKRGRGGEQRDRQPGPGAVDGRGTSGATGPRGPDADRRRKRTTREEGPPSLPPLPPGSFPRARNEDEREAESGSA